MINIILCGGSGTRLWPLSRECLPKQFITFLDQQTLLQKTALGNSQHSSEFIVVCSTEHANLVQKQLDECSLQPRAYILEPSPRNTAAAVCLSLFSLDPEEIVLITPSDHLIDYSEGYQAALKQAREYAENDEVTIFGIFPHSADTGYGYIEVVSENTVKRFHEKPSALVAQQYLMQGNYFWNSGMICAKAGVLLKALQVHAPNILKEAETAYSNASITKGPAPFYKIPEEEMSKIPPASIDHALLEKMESLKFVQGNFQWSDVGSFDSLFTQLPKDGEGNAVNAKDFLSVDSKNNLVIGNNRMISTIDVEDLVIVDTPDALLIAKLGSTQKVREVVNKLRISKTNLHRAHAEENRPWGSFKVLESQETCKVKRLVVTPGKRLSLQKHAHRSEHWVVVAGTALVTVGEHQHLLYPNQSVFIPMGELHRIENPGKNNLIIIEVQYGEYTGEDDITRIEDDFLRAPAPEKAIH